MENQIFKVEFKGILKLNPITHGIRDQPRRTGEGGGGYYSPPGGFSLKAYNEGKNEGGNFLNLIKYDVEKVHKKNQAIRCIQKNSMNF